MLTMIHCEDGALIGQRHSRAGGDRARRTCALPVEPAGRDRVRRGGSGHRHLRDHRRAGLPGARIQRACPRLRPGARARGLPVFVETRPIYLNLTDAVHAADDGGRFVGMPPVRTIADDRTPCGAGSPTDRCIPWPATTPRGGWPRRSIPRWTSSTARKGVAELETMLPMLYSEGVVDRADHAGTVRRDLGHEPGPAVRPVSAQGHGSRSARCRSVGARPFRGRTVDGATAQSAAGYSVYDGRRVAGWPRFVVGRGEVLLDDDGLHAAARAAAGQGPMVVP